MIIGKSFVVVFYLHLHINCVAPLCFSASQDKAFAYNNHRQCGQKKPKAFTYIIYRHFTKQCIKSKWVNIPTVSIFSDGPEAAAAAASSRGRLRGRLHPKVHTLKGQLISECLFEKIVWTKIPTKNLIDSAQQRLLPQG